jgi:hypothetical protein
MKMHGTVLMAAVAVVALGCTSRVVREAGGDVDVSATSGGEDWGGGIRGIGGWSDLRGSAYARPTDTGTTVSLTIERGIAGAAYSWEVLEGTCGSQGRPLAEISTLPGVFLDKTGRGFAVGALPLKLERGRQYHINVYTSVDKRDSPIACGAITN